jgi:superfamily I DNA/RNA helicase
MLKLASGQSIGRNYKPFVNLVESYRTEIPNLLMRLELASVPAEKADTVLSSVHRFKGQEAGYVKIADDFGPFCTANLKSTGPAFVIDEEEANLAYVAVTRARVQLDLGGFAATLRESLLNARKLLDSQPIVY